MCKNTPVRVEKRLRPVVPLGRNRVVPFNRNQGVQSLEILQPTNLTFRSSRYELPTGAHSKRAPNCRFDLPTIKDGNNAATPFLSQPNLFVSHLIVCAVVPRSSIVCRRVKDYKTLYAVLVHGLNNWKTNEMPCKFAWIVSDIAALNLKYCMQLPVIVVAVILRAVVPASSCSPDKINVSGSSIWKVHDELRYNVIPSFDSFTNEVRIKVIFRQNGSPGERNLPLVRPLRYKFRSFPSASLSLDGYHFIRIRPHKTQSIHQLHLLNCSARRLQQPRTRHHHRQTSSSRNRHIEPIAAI